MSKLTTESTTQVNYMIIHELVKEQTKTEAVIHLSSKLLPINQQSISLLEILVSRYSSSKTNIRHGKFSDDIQDDEIFPTEFKDYISNVSNESFIKMAKVTLYDLKRMVQNISAAKGGYFIFADYTMRLEDFYAVFLIRNTEGKLVKKDRSTDSYQIDSIKHLDLEKLAMGCRINKGSYLKSEGRYLSFTRKNQDFSEYFTKWISAKELVDEELYTQALIDICQSIPLPLDIDGEIMTRDKLKRKVFEVIKASSSSMLRLTMLDELLFEGEDTFYRFAQEKGITIDPEFKPSKKILKRLVNISVFEDNIKLEFNFDDFENKIKTDGNLVIIQSQKLADSINKEYKE
jgi:nucleoid-associated protein